MSKHNKHSSPFMDASYRVTVSDPEIHFIEIDCTDDIFDFIVNAPYSRIEYKDGASFREPSDRELLEAMLKNGRKENSSKQGDYDKEKLNALRLKLYTLELKNAHLKDELKSEKAFAECTISTLTKLNNELADKLRQMQDQLKNRGEAYTRDIKVQQLEREKAVLASDKADSDKLLRIASVQRDANRAELIRTQEKLKKCETDKSDLQAKLAAAYKRLCSRDAEYASLAANLSNTQDKLEKCEDAYARLHEAYTILKAHYTSHSYADFDK